MAHPYTTRARLDRLIRPERLVYLLDVDRDGTEDTGVFDDAIERGANMVDAVLCTMYVVPFAGIADSTPTPGVVSDLCDYYTAELLFSMGGTAAADDAKWFAQRAKDLVASIISGRAAVPGATPVSTENGPVAAVFSGAAATFAGSTSTSSSGTPRTRGLF